ncbi:MAG: divalent cation tolerance protein CutA [Patescibacteria group bacterium]
MLFDTIKKEDKDLVFIYTTCATRDEARALGFSALNEKLAVCTDYWPVESIYPWNGVIEDIEQYMVILTTQKSLSEKLFKFIMSLHQYNIPMIAEAAVKIKNPAYALWAQNIIADMTTEYISMEEKKKRDEYEAEGNFHPGRLK